MKVWRERHVQRAWGGEELATSEGQPTGPRCWSPELWGQVTWIPGGFADPSEELPFTFMLLLLIFKICFH